MKNRIYKCYNDLLSEKKLFNAWMREDSFDGSINGVEFVIHELSYTRTAGSVNEIEILEGFLKGDLKVLVDNYHSYMVLLESTFENRSRLRTYKGFLPEPFKSRVGSSQLEIGDEEQSIFIAIAPISNQDLNNITENFISANHHCFLILAEKLLDDNILPKFKIGDQISLNGTSSFNYFRVFSNLIDQGLILRKSGDGGTTEVGFQIFSPSDNMKIEKMLSNTVNG